MTLCGRIEALLASHGASEMCHTFELRRRPDARADVRLFFGDRQWLSGPQGTALLAALAAEPIVAEASRKQSAISIRFTDSAITQVADMLASGESAPAAHAPLAGSSYLVGFAGPNTSKALHLGHLRNIAIGNALAACLASAGARVVRQSLVGDIGRNICEAIAGRLRFHPGEDPSALGIKWDHFIGTCYSDYVRATAHANESDDPVSRETSVAGDEADGLMQRWLAGDPEVRETWRRTRELVMEGHARTLERMQVRIDRHDTESGSMEDIPPLIAEGLRRGILTRRADGPVIFESGRAEYPVMVLVRNDDFPTEHARLLAVYRHLQRERPAATYVDLAGSEWQPASAVHQQILRAMESGEDPPDFEHVFLFHGMVTLADEQKMSSSSGDALLIDEILDRVSASPQVQSIAAGSAGALSVESVAAMVAKGFFVSRPMSSTLQFSWDAFLGDVQNPGLQFARTWATLAAPGGPDADGGPLTDVERLMVLRSEAMHRNIEQSVTQLSVTNLASFLSHLCEHAVEETTTPRLRRLMRSMFATTLLSVGLLSEA